MKHTTRGIIGAVVLFITCAIQAQLQTSELQLVPADQVPSSGTFWMANGPAGQSLPPLPWPPDDLDVPIYALSNGQFLVDNSGVDNGVANVSGRGARVASTSSMEVPGGDEPPWVEPAVVPNIPNYQKFMAQAFSLIDTNDAAANDTNLYNACLGFAEDTNTAPTLQIARYGTNAVMIKANHFDYSSETRDFALVICDRVERPLYKSIDLAAPDSQDGWLVQGSVPNWKVSDPMYLLVSNITRTYNGFFRAIPYSGPEVQLAGAQPYDTVSNTVTFQATIADLSGVTNEQFEVTVDGIPPRYSLGASNALSIDTKYSPAGNVNVYLTASSSARIYDPTNPPDKAKLTFSGTATLPLDFENDTYLAFASDMCPTNVGTNFIVYVINKAQQVEASSSDPSNGQVVASYAGYFPYATAVGLEWNFTEADGVTPYSNDTYVVTFTAFDPVTLVHTNRIDRQGVREGAGCFLTYQWEDPGDMSGVGPFLNQQAQTWIGGTLQYLYSDLFWSWGITQYTPPMVGSGRDYVGCQPRDPWSASWESILKPALVATLYSDLTLGPAHGCGAMIGDSEFLPGGFTPADLKTWCIGASTNVGPNWRLRKAALWTCYSGDIGSATAGGYYITAWPDACGIRPKALQESTFIRKNCGLFFGSELPQAGIGSPPSSSAKVEATLDEIWVCGEYCYPGGCDPTYSFKFAVDATRGMYSPQLDWADPRLFGYELMIYSSIYDNELQMLDPTHVKTW